MVIYWSIKLLREELLFSDKRGKGIGGKYGDDVGGTLVGAFLTKIILFTCGEKLHHQP